ncbi:hypothetical protein KEM55_001696 [Ascosphaera atra]|nr:hypothetical protein KEM55_001696 [Ascosphaera atra]
MTIHLIDLLGIVRGRGTGHLQEIAESTDAEVVTETTAADEMTRVNVAPPRAETAQSTRKICLGVMIGGGTR